MPQFFIDYSFFELEKKKQKKHTDLTVKYIGKEPFVSNNSSSPDLNRMEKRSRFCAFSFAVQQTRIICWRTNVRKRHMHEMIPVNIWCTARARAHTHTNGWNLHFDYDFIFLVLVCCWLAWPVHVVSRTIHIHWRNRFVVVVVFTLFVVLFFVIFRAWIICAWWIW